MYVPFAQEPGRSSMSSWGQLGESRRPDADVKRAIREIDKDLYCQRSSRDEFSRNHLARPRFNMMCSRSSPGSP